MNTITNIAAAARSGGGLSLTESPFGSTATAIHALGWAVFPQSRGDRRPGKVRGDMLKPISAVSEAAMTWGQLKLELSIPR